MAIGNAGKVVIKAELDTKEFDKQVKNLEKKKITGEQFLEAQKTLRTAPTDSKEFKDALQIQRDYVKQAKEITQETTKQKTTTKEIGKETANVKKEIASAEQGVKKTSSAFSSIGKIIGGLAIAGIVALMFEAGSQSEEVKATLEQIGTIITNLISELAQMLLPIVEAIVNFIYKIFFYIGAILKEWFGIDLFAKKTSDSLNSGVKSAKALRKQLMGFDEMNILNKDTGSTGIGGVSGGTATTNLKFNVDEASLKKAYQKVKDFFLDLPIPINLDYVGDAIKNPKEYGKVFLERIASGFTTGGHTIASSIIPAIFGEDSFMTKIGDIGSAIVNPIGTALSKIRGFGSKMGAKFVEIITGGNKKETKANYTNIIQNINKMSDSMKNFLHITDGFADNLVDEFMNATTEINGDIVKVTTKSGKVIELTKEQYADLMESIIFYSQYGSKEQMNDMQNVDNKSKTTSDNTKKNWFTSLNDIVAKATGDDPNSLKGGLLGAFDLINNKSSKDAEETKKKWVNTADEMTKKFIGAFKDVPANTKPSLDETIKFAEKTINAFTPPKKKVVFEADVSKVKERLISLLTNFSNAGGLFGTINTNLISKIRNASKGAIINPPRLAKGGIINRPGRGVPIAVGGERGAEAVVPLTDNQQMAYLGREIAKNIIINLTSVTELDGRQIARATTQVMNDMNFASNGGVI